MLIAGFGVAVVAACCYEGAYIVQALEARDDSDGAQLQVALLRRLVRRPRWVAGTALAATGALLQIVALTLAPITVVQPTLALGLVLLLALSTTWLHERPGRTELVGVTLVIVGVTAVALMAPSQSSKSVGSPAAAVLLAVIGAAALAPFVLRRRVHDPRLRVLGAAAGDAWAAIALKLIADASTRHDWLPLLGWLAGAGLAALIALTAEMSALQQLAASRVSSVVLSAQAVVPVIAGPLALGESWHDTPLHGVLLGAAVLVVGGGAAVLGSSGAVAGHRIPAEEPDGPPAAPTGGPLGEQVEDDVGGEREPRVRRVG